jgi:hypothetical protein
MYCTYIERMACFTLPKKGLHLASSHREDSVEREREMSSPYYTNTRGPSPSSSYYAQEAGLNLNNGIWMEYLPISFYVY